MIRPAVGLLALYQHYMHGEYKKTRWRRLKEFKKWNELSKLEEKISQAFYRLPSAFTIKKFKYKGSFLKN